MKAKKSGTNERDRERKNVYQLINRKTANPYIFIQLKNSHSIEVRMAEMLNKWGFKVNLIEDKGKTFGVRDDVIVLKAEATETVE